MLFAHLQRHVVNHAKWLSVALLAVPAVLGALHDTGTTTENRFLAAFPEKPQSLSAVLSFPPKVDAWVNDHIGLRSHLIALNNTLRYALFGELPSTQTVLGQNQRIFLASHQAKGLYYSAIWGPCGVNLAKPSRYAQQINRFDAAMRQHGVDAKLYIPPSAPVVHGKDLPGWLATQCAAQPPALQQILAEAVLAPAAQARTLHPLQAMADAPFAIFPSSWFHWGGKGAQYGADLSIAHFWPQDRSGAAPLVSHPTEVPSDMGHLFPGLSFPSEVEAIDLAASGVSACTAPDCFPELPSIGQAPGAARYRNPKAPNPKLVLVTDSFGLAVGAWYAQYYQDVWLVPTNHFFQRSAPDLAAVRDALLPKGPTTQRTLFIYHDMSILSDRIPTDLALLQLDE